MLLIIANALALVVTSSLPGASITNGNQVAFCLISGFVVGVLFVGTYATIIYPLFPYGYLLPHLPRVIGYYILIMILWSGVWIGGNYLGVPTFMAQHFLACFWSIIAWTGVIILGSAKFG